MPPRALETGSAQNTPSTPSPIAGSSRVRGVTMTTLRSSEKKIACLASPIAWKVDCADTWKAWKKNPKK